MLENLTFDMAKNTKDMK